ncbi:ATP binding [Ceratocystis pirilliformis]|uniref:mitogen-activated protein kinase kinase kinase n=1 Tax=Ceratocystis pirilliformis TaxID=259994 RepID=A0ABR3ZAY0_9PEZI
MAMLTQKAFGSSLGPSGASMVPQMTTAPISATRHQVTMKQPSSHAFVISPTNSEFSDCEGPDSVKNWDENRVCEYLHSVKCGDYERLFRHNHINGENLLEMDKDVLKEIGVEKVGDRVRLFLSIKKLRLKTYANQKKRTRDSLGYIDSPQLLQSVGSKLVNNARSQAISSNGNNSSSGPGRRYSRSYQDSLAPSDAANSISRSESPSQTDLRPSMSRRYGGGNSSYSGARSPPEPNKSARLANTHIRNKSSFDGSLMAGLPQGQDVIRVISNGGVTKVVKISDCNTCEDVMRVTLRKFSLREDYERNYCFWVLNGLEPDPSQCRRLGDTELWRIIRDQTRPERNRLILRRVSASEPGEAELDRAAAIAFQETQQTHMRALETHDNKRSQLKVQKLLGENWNEGLQRPLAHTRYASSSPKGPDAGFDTDSSVPSSMRRKSSESQLRPFGGLRPPSELITSDLTSYFPDHAREDIDRTARLSVRRSTRLSRVNHRLSVASTMSFASSIQDAPPIPTIADSWLSMNGGKPRIASRLGNFRDSVASSVLEPLVEEAGAGDRKSFLEYPPGTVEPTVINVTDPDGHTMMRRSYYSDETATIGSGSGSIQELQEALNEDGEEMDEELQSFLSGESWDDNKWMKGALVGKGSFGSVYLALHAITGELLAVKQVQAPSGTQSQTDQRKKSMIDALKREISLLRDLKHPNIVQYLGCGTSAEYLNIFLEYVPGGSVQTMLNSYGALPEPLVRSFVRQILTGLEYLHERDIIHRDIKGANILVDNKGTIKISDFGISKKLEASNILNGTNNAKNRPSLQGSVFWMAPEVVRQTSYTRKADIWSLGCLVVEMMTGTHPFPDCTQLQAIFKIGGAKATPTIPEAASVEAKEFLGKTFEIDHNLRPNADELMLSKFLVPVA